LEKTKDKNQEAIDEAQQRLNDEASMMARFTLGLDANWLPIDTRPPGHQHRVIRACPDIFPNKRTGGRY
jgi:hypothetical protein